MTKDELVAIVTGLQSETDPEDAHIAADNALLHYIDDPEIATAYREIERWYA